MPHIRLTILSSNAALQTHKQQSALYFLLRFLCSSVLRFNHHKMPIEPKNLEITPNQILSELLCVFIKLCVAWMGLTKLLIPAPKKLLTFFRLTNSTLSRNFIPYVTLV